MRKTFHETLKKGSFNGVGFLIQSSSDKRGKRIETHEYPYRDNPYIEEYGKVAKEFSIEAWLIGDDCFAQRDNLITELEKAGEGKLIHPYYGEISVTIGDVSISTRHDEGRKVVITFTCHVGSQEFPSSVSIDLIPNAVDKANATFAKSFTGMFKIKGVSNAVFSQALKDFQKATVYANKAFAIVGRGKKGLLDVFKAELPTLFGDTGYLAQRWIGAISGLSVFAQRQVANKSNQQSPQRIINVCKKSSFGNKAGNDLIDRNSKTVNNFFNATLAVQAVKMMSDWVKEEEYSDDIKTSSNAVVGFIDELMLTASNEEYEAFVALREAVISDVKQGLIIAKNEKIVEVLEAMPTLLLAHDFGVDENKLIERNNIRHPLFGGYTMRVPV